MRTTVNLDERLVTAARARARAEGRSLGDVISELALVGLRERSSPQSRRGNLVMLPSSPGHVITNEMVADALADE